MDAYISDKVKGFTRKAILVIPGGGYAALAAEREGEPSAQAFIPYGYNAFVLHSSNDQIVNVKNALCLANALSDKGIKFEMHIYPDAPHGVALGNEITKCGNEKWVDTSIAKWVENAVEWAEKIC